MFGNTRPKILPRLPRRLGRDYKRIHEDVVTLVHAGLLERDAQGIRAPYERVHTEVSLV